MGQEGEREKRQLSGRTAASTRCFLERFKFSILSLSGRTCLWPVGVTAKPPRLLLHIMLCCMLWQLCLALQFTFGCITASFLADFFCFPAAISLTSFESIQATHTLALAIYLTGRRINCKRGHAACCCFGCFDCGNIRCHPIKSNSAAKSAITECQ